MAPCLLITVNPELRELSAVFQSAFINVVRDVLRVRPHNSGRNISSSARVDPLQAFRNGSDDETSVPVKRFFCTKGERSR